MLGTAHQLAHAENKAPLTPSNISKFLKGNKATF